MTKEFYVGCMFCGIRRDYSMKEVCSEEVDGLIPGHENQTHLWTEMFEAPEYFRGHTFIDLLK